MKGYGYAGLLIAATITTASASAASSEQQSLPAPTWQLEAAAQKQIGQTAQTQPLQKPQTHYDALLQRQMRQLERLREEAQKDEERAQKLQQLLQQS
ncbi:hypothetical protein [Microbulbifer hainanensis]|uniref:hypothetical protein n=1 Tax=Microbulbifer hainanensis TaxID=2735675 RepID=UPI001867A2E4|nr:hypothetical protein [Microbulbifer hainanensis]